MSPKPHASSPDLLRIEQHGAVCHVQITRPAKRNALNDALIERLRNTFTTLPGTTRAVVLSGEGEHFCAGLDLSSLSERSVADGIWHSRSWHHAFEEIQFGRVPVVAVLRGAVVGGGLELASAAHIRVAEASTFFIDPAPQRVQIAHLVVAKHHSVAQVDRLRAHRDCARHSLSRIP